MAHSDEVFEEVKNHREEVELVKADRDKLFMLIREPGFHSEWIKKNFIY
jgi:hypothetical protein